MSLEEEVQYDLQLVEVAGYSYSENGIYDIVVAKEGDMVFCKIWKS